jgi:hypothetical protein
LRQPFAHLLLLLLRTQTRLVSLLRGLACPLGFSLQVLLLRLRLSLCSLSPLALLSSLLSRLLGF